MCLSLMSQLFKDKAFSTLERFLCQEMNSIAKQDAKKRSQTKLRIPSRKLLVCSYDRYCMKWMQSTHMWDTQATHIRC